MEDYRANSHKAKAEAKEAAEKKVDKVVTGNVKRKKKSEVSKFKDVFISEDVSNVSLNRIRRISHDRKNSSSR